MKKIFTILLLLTAGKLASAQTEDVTVTIAKSEFKAKQVIPPSPIAAELGKYGNTPVSLFTGTPNISIPLFDLKGTLLSLPISLSYNASGFKPAEMAPWTGSGWSLNGGGVITRSVLGNPDISSNYFACPYPLTPPTLPTTTKYIFPYYDYMNSAQNSLVEPQPDMYYFNFAGHTGKFVLKPDQTVVKKKKDMLIITSGILATNSNFTIKDEQGSVYTFSDIETSRTQPNDEGGQPVGLPYSYPSSWFLTKVQTADGNEEIDFTYYATTGEQTLYPDNSQSQSSSYRYATNNLAMNCSPPTYSGYSGVAPTTYIKKKFLQKITLLKAGQEVGHVDFISTAGRSDSDFPEDRILNQVNIYTPNPIGATYRLIKRYNLTYSYFGTSPNLRLRLDGVQEMAVDATTTSKPPYQFTYDSSIGNPNRFTNSIDHWGFFNNAGNTTLVPAETEYGFAGQFINAGLNSNREPALAGSSCTILNKIQYPTGGYTVFSYELNGAKNGNNNNTFQYVGGLRVHSITDFSATSQQATVKTYNYLLDDNTTSGVAEFPIYVKTTTSTHYNQPCIGLGCTVCTLYTGPSYSTTYTVSTNSIYGLGSVAGSQVGYTQVTENQNDAITAVPLGKTVYKYNIGLGGVGFSDGHDEDISNGDLAEQTVYDGNGKLIKDVTNTYTYGNLGSVSAYMVKPNVVQTNQDYYYQLTDSTYVNQFPWQTAPSGVIASRELFTQLFIEQYSFSSQSSQLTQKIEKTYDQVSGLYKTQSASYVYGNPLHIYPTQTTVTSTGNTQVVTQKVYAGDYPYNSVTTDTAASAIVALNNNNMLGTEIESLQYRQNSDGSNKHYIDGSLTTYVSTPIPTPYKIYSLESIIPLSTVTPSSINGSGVFTYDSHYKLAGTFKYLNNNLVEQSKAYGPVTSYLWDYSQIEPVASVTNTHSTNIAYTGFETSSITNNWVAHLVLLDTTTSFTGRVSGVLSAGSKIDATFTVAPPLSVVSYWASGPATVMSNTTVNVPISSQGLTANGWTYYEHLLPAGTTQVELTGSVHIDELRLYPILSQMQTESYDPLVGVTGQVTPGNQVLNYKYDGLGRVVTIKDVYGNIKQNLVYNYGSGVAVTSPAQTLFFNSLQQQTFTKQGCTGSTPQSVVYQVPYGRYSAATQATADQLALNDIATNGQTYANVTGLCLYYNDQAYSRRFFKNDCTADQGLGSPVVYTVAAGTVYSLISVADADVQAQALLTNNGQANANALGTCSCGAEGQKMISGTCTTGTKIYISSTPSNGQFICVYEYLFSDGTYSQTYTVVSPTNCVNN